MATNYFSNPAPAVRRMRAYFAPVQRATQTPTVFNASTQGGFDLDSPPAPWISLGWITGFTRKAASKSRAVMTGVPAAALAQVRESVEAEVGFEFLSWTKLTMALAIGSQHMNLLATTAAVALGSGSTASFLAMAASDAATFTAGSMAAVDSDYAAQTGYVGAPVAGAYLRQALSDVDYIRRVTFNVARVAQVTSTGLALAEALPGGAPTTAMKAQALSGFVDREGGSFYQEWSALFAAEGSQGERIFFYYPRLQAMSGAEETAIAIGGEDGALKRIALKGRFLALPATDALDGERVVCYRSFLPAGNALI